MKKLFVLLTIMLYVGLAGSASAVTVTPVSEISTSKKTFQLGNTYKFRNVSTDEIYTGNVVYYRPNGMFGQEAQIEIANFVDENGKYIPGKITIIPDNHKAFQEFMNYFSISVFAFVRGSEIFLQPDVHQFVLDDKNRQTQNMILLLKNNEPISTCYDELEILDVVEFKNIADVYKNGKLYIKSGMSVYGIIDTVDENGWCADNAAIYFKKFYTKDVAGNKITINSDLIIDGFEVLKFKSERIKQFFNYISTFIRGKEVDIKDTDKNVIFVLIAN